jgi:hypothetical protein
MQIKQLLQQTPNNQTVTVKVGISEPSVVRPYIFCQLERWFTTIHNIQVVVDAEKSPSQNYEMTTGRA